MLSVLLLVAVCQYCVHMDVATIAGLLMASVLATVFLAVAVSKIAAPEPGRISQGKRLAVDD